MEIPSVVAQFGKTIVRQPAPMTAGPGLYCHKLFRRRKYDAPPTGRTTGGLGHLACPIGRNRPKTRSHPGFWNTRCTRHFGISRLPAEFRSLGIPRSFGCPPRCDETTMSLTLTLRLNSPVISGLETPKAAGSIVKAGFKRPVIFITPPLGTFAGFLDFPQFDKRCPLSRTGGWPFTAWTQAAANSHSNRRRHGSGRNPWLRLGTIQAQDLRK